MGDIKQQIANILGVENSELWEITSSNPEKNLYVIHYVRNANLTEVFYRLRYIKNLILPGQTYTPFDDISIKLSTIQQYKTECEKNTFNI